MTLQTLVLAIGLVLVFEGLVFVLAPRRIEDILRLLASMPIEARRMIGLVALVIGAVVVTLSGMLGAG
ncbi:DUF2065 domain-containing protein [Roseinatronobacter bogoriensis]|uniref:DUF2065 domain-containing protein n=1 Tax=Roseinatronobacter bogoriensis TaxID=119542 RepID=UPI0008F909F9|nr:DUF2065 domain-containing protein [Rhodobaca bogoriensis]MBB4208140.1 hypothetical protein [Rhodobaca bogoriensis DSM 18756]TDW38781.1 hypothetical protein LY39_01807 [Rhodobaca barguzinensis]TDY69181.1 hypothetical protein EV660_10461 [Rhodobaca bogoriensis DSM 18756]